MQPVALALVVFEYTRIKRIYSAFGCGQNGGRDASARFSTQTACFGGGQREPSGLEIENGVVAHNKRGGGALLTCLFATRGFDSRCTIKETRIENCTESCIFVDNDAHLKVLKSVMHSADAGLLLNDRSKLEILNCDMRLFHRGAIGQVFFFERIAFFFSLSSQWCIRYEFACNAGAGHNICRCCRCCNFYQGLLCSC